MIRRAVIGAALLLAVLVATPAAAQYNPFVVGPIDVRPGGQVTVSGQGCKPFETVTVYLVPGDKTAVYIGNATKPPASTAVAVGTSDGNGNFTITFTVPANASPGPYTVVASCGAVLQAQLINVFVDAPGPTGTGVPPAVGGGNLPRTGSNLNGIGLVGAALLAAGGLLLLATRRRHSESPTAA